MEPVIIFVALFALVFGVAFLYYTTRHKERMALIEKGETASLFFGEKKKTNGIPIWKIILLNLALLCTGVGLGVLLGNILMMRAQMEEEIAYTASIFLMIGISLLSGYLILNKKANELEKSTN